MHRMPAECTPRRPIALRAAPVSDDGRVDTLGGYRLVRKLGSGSSAEVWLGSDGSHSAALKVYRPGADTARIDAEIEALGRASHRHLLTLDDLSTGPDGLPCLILQRLSTFSLGRLLAARQPAAGEAVTILAPLAAAIAELHRVGVAHGAVAPRAVLFDESGAPVLARFGSAELFGDFPEGSAPASLPPALLAQERAVSADLDRLVELCVSTLGRAGGDVTRWLATESERAPDSFPRELADRLFSLATPSPVFLTVGDRGDGRGSAPDSLRPHRGDTTAALPLSAANEDANLPARPPSGGILAEVLGVLHMPESMSSAIVGRFAGIGATWSIPALKVRIAAVLRPVRKPVWIIAAAVAAAVVAFTAFVPAQTGTGAGARTGPPAASPGPVVLSPAAPVPDRGAAGADPAIVGDDPVAAGMALLRARAECFDSASVLCLDAVDQQGSSAMESDGYRIRIRQAAGGPKPQLSSIVEGSPVHPGALQLAVVERLGDTVLLSLSLAAEAGAASATGAPASLLLIRGDRGWRIRDLIAADQASG